MEVALEVAVVAVADHVPVQCVLRVVAIAVVLETLGNAVEAEIVEMIEIVACGARDSSEIWNCIC
jgi:hypothetical protein